MSMEAEAQQASGHGAKSGGGGAANAAASWFSPARLLALFCLMCLFIYMDRGMIASNGIMGAAASPGHPTASGIEGDFGTRRVPAP